MISKLDLVELEDYDFWIRNNVEIKENEEGVQELSYSCYPYKYSMWQYSDKGSVDGINGNVWTLKVVRPAYSSYIENCYARYGGAIAVCGHDCKIANIIFQSNTGIDNGGNDLYVYWGDCRVNDCTFDKEQEGAAAYITADTYFTGCNITKDMCVGDVHQVYITNPTASMLSVGYPEIVYGIGGLAVGFFAAMLIFRKKKVSVSSTAAEDKE